MSSHPRSVLALAAALVLGACGVAGEESFRPVPDTDVPFGLLAASSTVAATTTRPTVPTTPLPPAPRPSQPPTTTATAVVHLEVLYFVRDGKLVSVTRTRPSPPSLDQVIADLVAGGRPDDTPAGLRTVLEPEHLTSASAAGGVVTVGITAALAAMPTGEQQLAIAQLVYTLTARPGIGQVAFELDGKPVAVPRSDGSLAVGRITRDDLAGALTSPERP